MGNSAAPPPLDSSELEGEVECTSIKFRKIWTGAENYQLAELELKTSSDISRDWFYHDLLGISFKAPIFATSSIIGSCNFTRDKTGENHTFYGIWEGEMKPNDTISYKTYHKKKITIRVKNKEELGQYIKDPTRSSDFVEYKNKFKYKSDWTSEEFGELKLEVTKNKYYRSKKAETIWSIYKIKIPKSLIIQELENAVAVTKPEIIEQFIEVKPKETDKGQTDSKQKEIKAITLGTDKGNDDDNNNNDGEDVKFDEKEKLLQQVAALKEENDKLKKENKELRLNYNRLLRKTKIDESEYESWDADMICNWIISLDEQYEIYEETLRENLMKEDVVGTVLSDLERNDLHRFGVESIQHKISIMKEIQRITQQGK